MADILIKGMEMPSDEMHSVVLIFGKDGFVNARDSYSTLEIEGITAVALPNHGRLIDAVALKGSIEGKILAGQDVNVFSEIDNATTVLEAIE